MYRKQHNGQLSIEVFHLSFGGKFDPENRWVLLSGLTPWEELEETYAPQFSPLSVLLQSPCAWRLELCSSSSVSDSPTRRAFIRSGRMHP
jgi:hypothetical protein